MLRGITWKARVNSEDIIPLIKIAQNSIKAIQTQIQQKHHRFVEYNMKGKEIATTTVHWPPAADEHYNTHAQMHSEMYALLNSMAPTASSQPIWKLNNEGHVLAENNYEITKANYFTDLPHCGYCTVMLEVLNLPLSNPTAGRYNLARNLLYQVPRNVFDNIDVLSRLVNSNQAGDGALLVIKQMVNIFINKKSAEWALHINNKYVTDTEVSITCPSCKEILVWEDATGHWVMVNLPNFGNNTLLGTLWKIVYQGIYDRCGGQE